MSMQKEFLKIFEIENVLKERQKLIDNLNINMIL